MKFISKWLVSTLAIIITAYLINRFSTNAVIVDSLFSALVASLVLGIINTLIKPVVHILALPITLITFGLFAFVINALSVLLVAWLVPGFAVAGFWVALIFSIVLSVISWSLSKIV